MNGIFVIERTFTIFGSLGDIDSINSLGVRVLSHFLNY
jgi:hypothetical protein